MTAAENAVFMGYNLKIVVQWGWEGIDFGGGGESTDRGMFLGGGNEQIFDWWGVTCPITSSRENPRD